MVGKIPEEADINMSGKEAWVTLLLVPGNAKGRDPQGNLFFVIGVTEITIGEKAIRHRHMIDAEVVLILGDGANAFGYPNIDDGITYHTRITAGRRGSKWMCMINEEIALCPLNH